MLIAFILICFHYIADFIFQDEEWALNKSKSFIALLKHTIIYSIIFTSFVICYNFAYWLPILTLFLPITFMSHTVVDYITSKIVSKRFVNKYLGGPIPNFGAFSIIGLDQVIHYGILFLTYYLILG